MKKEPLSFKRLLFLMPVRKQINVRIAIMAFIVIVPIILWILPADFFDNGQSICVSKLISNIDCPGCGMTRACMHLIHFDLENAYAYNMMSFIVMPVLAFLWIKWLFIEWKIFKQLKQTARDQQEMTI